MPSPSFPRSAASAAKGFSAPRRRGSPRAAEAAGPSVGAGLARIGRQRQRQRLGRHQPEVDAVAERLDLVVLVGIDARARPRAARLSGRQLRRTGWSMRVVTGSSVTTQVWTTVAPSVAVELPAAAAAAARAGRRSAACAPPARPSSRASAAASAGGRGDVEVELVEVAELAQLDRRGRIRDCRGRGG